MEKIEALIKHLTELKEELNKNMNCAPGSKPNMAKEEMEKDAANPNLAPKEVKIKELQSKIDSGKYKVPASKIADKMLKEELTCSENGQWNIKVK